jgi:ABC-type transporter MlaC component
MPHAAGPAPHVAAPRAMPQPSRPPRVSSAPPRAAPRHVERPTPPPATGGRSAPSVRREAPVQPSTSAARPALPQPSKQLANRPAPSALSAHTPAPPSTQGLATRPPQSTAAARSLGAAARPNITNPQARAVTPPVGATAAVAAAASTGHLLRDPAFASRSTSRDPQVRALAQSTFQGSFATRFPDWNRKRVHFFPIVTGFIGPLFWPFAEADFIDFTFYPYAYDAFWPFAYDNLYEDMFGTYAYGGGTAYAYGGGTGYAAIGRPQVGGGRRAIDVCSAQAAGLTDWPIDAITQAVAPDDAQRAALDELKAAAANAVDVLRAACPNELASTPIGRINAMDARLAAMLQATRIVRPALANFYQALSDEQKARFNALGYGEEQQDESQTQRNLAQVCNEGAAGIASLPIERIGSAVGPDEQQRSGLDELRNATSQAVDLLKSDCPTYRPLTPVARLEMMEQRLDAMLRAVETVQPALTKFYGSLNDEQKERFNRLNPRTG